MLAGGLKPSSQGKRARFARGKKTAVDAPRDPSAENVAAHADVRLDRASY